MSTETIPIAVSSQTATAFKKASPERRRAAQQKAAEILRLTLMSRDELADEYDRLTARTSAHAQAKGWTDEMNEALLRGDYDD